MNREPTPPEAPPSMPARAPLFHRAAIALSLLLSTAAAQAVTLSFDSDGGEAWSFEPRLEGRIVDGRCDEVRLHSPLGAVTAWSDAGRFAGEVPLTSGTNRVEAVCLQAGRAVASAAQDWELRLPDGPRAWVRTRADANGVTLDAGRSERGEGRPAPLRRFQWRPRADNPAPLYPRETGVSLDERAAEGEQLALELPRADGEYFLTLTVTDALGRRDESTAVFRVESGVARAVDLAREHPAWVDTAVLYGVAPFFFGEGGFDDVAERLDAIKALGATAIWLAPVTATPADDFGYAVTDHFRLRDTFGSEADFRALVDAAHARGLKVLMDFVPNHFSDRHRYYLDADRRGPRSPYYDWFERDADGEIQSYFDWDNLKNLDYDNPEVQNHVIAAFAHWVREYGIDGFRVDASWAVAERAPEFWSRWRAELKRIDPDLFLLAEASAREPYFVANGFDAAYDWTGELGQWAWHDVFVDGRADLARLRAALTNAGAGFSPDTLALRFLNNNDTGARFIARHGPGLTKAAATLVFTLPGVPLIYNGDEVGAEFEPYDEAPPIVWRDRLGLSQHYAQLSRLRRATPALYSRELEVVDNDREDAVLSFLRPSPEGAVLVAINFTGEPVRVTLARGFTGAAEDLLSGTRLTLDPRAPTLELPPFGARVLDPRP